MSKPRHLLGWPLGLLPLALPALAIVALTAAQTAAFADLPYLEWPSTSSQFHEQLLLVAPLSAAAATYYAGRLTPPARIFALPSAPRAGLPTVTRHLTALVGSFGAAFLIGMAPLTVLTVIRASSGTPDLLAILTGLLGLVAAIAAGYLAGVFAGTAWASPVVLILGFVAMQLNASSDAFVAVTPVMHVVADAGRSENLMLSLYRLGFFVFVAAVSVLLAAQALRRPRRWKLPSPASWAVLAVASALVVVPAVKPPAILAEETDPPIVCGEHDELEYCVHEAHRAELDALSEAVPSVLAAHGSAPRSLRYVADVAGKHGLRDADRSNAIWVSLAPGNPNRYQARNAAAGYLSGMPACLDRFGPAVSPEEGPAQLRLAHGLGNWLLNRASDRAAAPATPFDGVSPAAMHEWISVHQHEIRTCTLGVEDVP